MGHTGGRSFIITRNFWKTKDAGRSIEQTGRFNAENGRNIYVPYKK
jgi:hypothetical protein